jgi:NADH-quinone oxidoreductase subunit C
VTPPEAVADDDETIAEPASAPEPERRHGALLTISGGQAVLHPARESWVEVITALRADGYWMCVDLCGVDYLSFSGHRGLPDGVDAERFEVVVNLIDHTSRRRIRLRVQVPADDPTLATLFKIHPGTEAMEREAFDMFGITFDGHPDMTRILMPDTWVGHPLRKDYDVGRIPVQFKGAPGSSGVTA